MASKMDAKGVKSSLKNMQLTEDASIWEIDLHSAVFEGRL